MDSLSIETRSDLPPSAKLVVVTLDYEGALTQQELAAETRLHPRTVRYGLTRLEEHNLIESRPSLRDARKTIYSLQIDDES